MQPFDLLHPGVQRELWRMGWTALRPLQEHAIEHIMTRPGHALLTAATAAGKTEAAFLPILSKIADEPTGSVRAMYIGPLKALINDQFSRVEELCGYLDMPVHSWHGDVSASHKKHLLDNPAGVLLITPESLESLFVNRPDHLPPLFGGLRFVVIDEIHSFLDNERGLHLRSLLCRLRPLASDAFRIVGLSATIGDLTVAQRYIDPDHPEQVTVIEDSSSQKETRYRIHGYRMGKPAKSANDAETAEPQDDPDQQKVAEDIVAHCAGAANLVFANAKADVEEFADLCTRIASGRHLPDQFLVHHGSLSADIREEAEQIMKETARAGRPATAFCSSTLEMGIDIGSVRMVGQIGAPWSVSSLKQRIGRSGRKASEPHIMRVYIRCRDTDADSDLFDRLHLRLVQASAASELMLERWVEPARLPVCDLSTLAHQVMSVLAQTGGLRADAIFQRLCAAGAFREIEPPLFARLLRALAAADIIEQVPTGELILGLQGETLRKDKAFYAVFQTPDEFAVLYNEQRLGTLQTSPAKGDHLLFAGRRWQIVEVDEMAREIRVQPAAGYRRPRFDGAAGELHPRLRQMMRQVLSESRALPYLDPAAQDLLDAARKAAASAGALGQSLIPLGPKITAFMTWTGSRIQQTLAALFAALGIETADKDIALVFHDMDVAAVRAAIAKAAAAPHDPLKLSRLVFPRVRRKYDALLGDDLLDESIARGWLDIAGAEQILRSPTDQPASARV